MKNTLVLLVGILGLAVFAAPAPDLVAEGYPSYEGVTSGNYIYGRQITPSDLRHRAVMIIQCDATKMQEQLLAMAALRTADGFPAGEVQWDTAPYPRKAIIVVSVTGGEFEMKAFHDVFKSKNKVEEKQTEENQTLGQWRAMSKAFYYNVKPVGVEIGNAPFVTVLDGTNAKPLYNGAFNAKKQNEIRNAMTKATMANKDWTPITGVSEIQHWPKIDKDIKKGKSLKACQDAIKQGIKDKDPDKAKEAQIVYDAIAQYRSDLRNRIMLEASQAPARAYMDSMALFKQFPQEKKALATVMSKLNGSKEISTIGKCMAQFMEWSNPDYVCKSASDAKKNVATMNGWKKILEKLQTHPNASISGEAALINSQLDALIEAMPSKVQQKQ